jgi:hypothetical protein
LLSARQRDPLFRSRAGATILLSHDVGVRAANTAYTVTTERHADDVLKKHSMGTNVRLADVAATIVHLAQKR